MPLTLYRRHSLDCRVHTFKISPKAKREYSDCDCMIWITGKTDKQLYPRQSTKLRDWKAAQAWLRTVEAQNKDTAVYGPTLENCIERYLDSRKNELGPKAATHTRLLLNRLKAYAHQHNKHFIQELTVDLLEDFKTYGLTSLKKDTSKATSVAKLRCFLREAYRRGWILESLAEKVKAHTAIYDQKTPYSDGEIFAILEAAENYNGGHTGYASNGKTFRVLMELMLETGMRAGDAVRFDPSQCVRSTHLWVYTFFPQKRKKSQAPVSSEVYLTDRLKTAIDQCAWMSESLPFAYLPIGKTSYMAIEVWRNMQRIGSQCEPKIKDCRPHRLRDTFAIRALLKGIPLEDVSKLLCHQSVAVTEKYYAPWIPSRKLRLERLLFESLVHAEGN